MQKNVSKRLGCVTAHGGEEAIKHHSFFRDIKWKDLEDRKVKPPFRPKIVSKRNAGHNKLGWLTRVVRYRVDRMLER